MARTDVDEEIFTIAKEEFGFVPNLIREMGRSPAVARVYLAGQEAMAGASLTLREQQAVQLAVSVYNECHYCRAAHAAGGRRAGMASRDLEAIQRGALPGEPRLRALVSAAWQVMDLRGRLREEDLRSLEAERVGRAQVYEIVAIIGLKTISNYVNHIGHTEIDAAFRE